MRNSRIVPIAFIVAVAIVLLFPLFFNNEIGYFNVSNSTNPEINTTPQHHNYYFKGDYFDFSNNNGICEMNTQCRYEVCVKSVQGNYVTDGNMTITIAFNDTHQMQVDKKTQCYYIDMYDNIPETIPVSINFTHPELFNLTWDGKVKFYPFYPIEFVLWKDANKKERYIDDSQIIRLELSMREYRCYNHPCHFEGRYKDGLAIVKVPFGNVDYNIYMVRRFNDANIKTKIRLGEDTLDFGNRYNFVMNPAEVWFVTLATSLKMLILLVIGFIFFFMIFYLSHDFWLSLIIVFIMLGMLWVILP